MTGDNPRATAAIAGHPIHAMLVPIPAACFVGAFFTDVVYAETANMQWANMSAWMLAVGVIVGILAAIAGATDFLGDRRIRSLTAAWIHAVGNTIALVLSVFNCFVHSRDAYTSVVPAGLVLSAVVVVIVAVTSWMGSSMVFRHRVGVRPEDAP